jgi:hypothetical protein
MENMAEEELLPLEEEEEVAQVRVPSSAADSARVPAPAPDSAPASDPTPASALAPALTLAQAPALSPSLASAPEEAESSKCRALGSLCRREASRGSLLGSRGALLCLGWILWGKVGLGDPRAAAV